MAADIPPVLSRLMDATNAHDLDALVDCFATGYRNETPGHPSRGFQGNGQVRSNWAQIFTFVPDVHAVVLNHAVNGEEIWSEWEMTGTRLDHTEHWMRGVIVFHLADGRAASARFYLEPVDETASSIDATIQRQTHAGTTT